MSNSISKRIGRFNYSSESMRNPTSRDYEILKHFIVLQAEFNIYDNLCVNIIAISDLFDEISIGDEIPKYTIIIHMDPEGSEKVMDVTVTNMTTIELRT